MEPGHIIIIDEYCSSPYIKEIARRLLEARYEVIVIGPGMSLPRDISPTHNRHSLFENEVDLQSLKDLISFKRSGYPEHGHYRVDFRTGKPLRY